MNLKFSIKKKKMYIIVQFQFSSIIKIEKFQNSQQKKFLHLFKFTSILHNI